MALITYTYLILIFVIPKIYLPQYNKVEWFGTQQFCDKLSLAWCRQDKAKHLQPAASVLKSIILYYFWHPASSWSAGKLIYAADIENLREQERDYILVHHNEL